MFITILLLEIAGECMPLVSLLRFYLRSLSQHLVSFELIIIVFLVTHRESLNSSLQSDLLGGGDQRDEAFL